VTQGSPSIGSFDVSWGDGQRLEAVGIVIGTLPNRLASLDAEALDAEACRSDFLFANAYVSGLSA
jgi:hypothetical protein